MLFVSSGKYAKLREQISEDEAIRYFNANVVGVYYTTSARKIIIPKHSSHFLYEDHNDAECFRDERARFLPWLIPTITKTSVIRGTTHKPRQRENFLAIVGIRGKNQIDEKYFSVILEWRKKHYQLITILDLSKSQYDARKGLVSRIKF